MADATVGAGKTGVTVTLTADAVTTVTFTDRVDDVNIISDATAAVIYTADGSVPTNPSAGTARVGSLIPAGAVLMASVNTVGDIVKLLSAGTPTVTVERA